MSIQTISFTRWNVALGVVLVMVLGLLGTQPAQAAPAAPSGLSPNSVTISTSPILTWSRVSGATSYQVEVSGSSSFDTILFSSTTTNRRSVPTTQLPSTTTHWRVRGVNSSSQSGPWATATFTRSAIAPPTLLSPDDAEVLPQPTRPPLLSWSSINGATGYEIQIDDEVEFIQPTSYTTKNAVYVVPDPQVPATYYWRARGVVGAGLTTLWSQPRSYTVEGLPDAVQMSPGPTVASVVDDVVLRWQPVLGAVDYEVRVSTDISFPPADTVTAAVKGTTFSPTTTFANNDYYWQVRPRDLAGRSPAWPATSEDVTWKFRRAWADQPSLEHPTGTPASPGTVGDPFYYQWTAPKLASHYEIQLDNDPDFSTDLIDSCVTRETTYVPTDLNDCWPAAQGTYYWRVLAYDGPKLVESEAVLSSVGRFTYDPADFSPELLAPTPGTTVDVPTLTWAPVAGAATYTLTITAIDGGSGGGTISTSSTTYTPRSMLSAGKTYRWQVQARSKSGRLSSGILPIAQPLFTVSGDLPVGGATPLPTSPATGAAFDRFPGLTWTSVTDATFYQVRTRPEVGTGWTYIGGNSNPTKFSYAAGDNLDTSLLQPDSYQWTVDAFNGSTFLTSTPPSSERTITINNLADVSGHRLALTGSALAADDTSCLMALPEQCQGLNQTPVLQWDDQPNAAFFRVWLSNDRNLTNPIVAGDITEANQWTPTNTLIDSQAGVAFYWHIQPCVSVTQCSPLQAADHAFQKRSNPVQLLGPAMDATTANAITFTWRDFLATNQDPEFIDDTGIQSRVEAKQYRIEISNNTGVLDTAVVDQSTYTATHEMWPEGPIYWRVQAIDGSATPRDLTWSETRTLQKVSPKPDLSAGANPALTKPAIGAQVTSQQPFSWQPVPFAARYQIEVYKNVDQTLSSANLVLSSTVKQAAYTSQTPLPVFADGYLWRVRRLDASSLPGDWSALRPFDVMGDAPTLTSPSAGVRISHRDALFTWASVNDASTYLYQRRPSGSSTLSESVTTAALAWAPTKSLPTGTWVWRVTSLDANGKTMASSAWRTFEVDATAPVLVSKSPVGSAYRSADFVARFSEPVRNTSTRTMRLYQAGRSTPLLASVTLSSDGKRATLNPRYLLRSGKVYTLKLSSGITDKALNALVATSWKATAK